MVTSGLEILGAIAGVVVLGVVVLFVLLWLSGTYGK